jgi:hypothetical protein
VHIAPASGAQKRLRWVVGPQARQSERTWVPPAVPAIRVPVGVIEGNWRWSYLDCSRAWQGGERWQTAVTLYGLVLLTVRLLLAGLFAYASWQGLLIEALARPDSEEVAAVRRKFTPTIVAYVATIAVGLLIPAAAVAVYFGIAIFVVTPFRRIVRLLRHRHSTGQ